MPTMVCPRCSSHHVYQSQSGNQKLPTVVNWFISSWRCHYCCHQFFRAGSHKDERDVQPPQETRRAA